MNRVSQSARDFSCKSCEFITTINWALALWWPSEMNHAVLLSSQVCTVFDICPTVHSTILEEAPTVLFFLFHTVLCRIQKTPFQFNYYCKKVFYPGLHGLVSHQMSKLNTLQCSYMFFIDFIVPLGEGPEPAFLEWFAWATKRMWKWTFASWF